MRHYIQASILIISRNHLLNLSWACNAFDPVDQILMAGSDFYPAFFFCDNLWLSPYIVPLNSSHIRIPKSQSCRSTYFHVTTNWKLALFPLDTQLCHKGPCFLSRGPGVCNALHLEMNPQSLDVALCSTLQFQPWGATWEYQPSLLFKTKAQG